MKRVFLLVMLFCILTLAIVNNAQAQSPDELQLGLSRDFGYGGFGNDIQGLFSLKIKNPPANLVKVEFFIDATSMGVVSQSPFSLQFTTDSYPLGTHTLSAVGYTADGSEMNSNKIEAQFVPAGAATKTMAKVIVPIVGLVVLMVVVSVALPLILNKGKLATMAPGTPRKYGIGGGAICPKCGRPFPLRLWWLNLGLSKIDRCPYCGKWSLVRPSSMADLRAAEAAELTHAQPEQPIIGETEADKLKKELDDSKFQNM